MLQESASADVVLTRDRASDRLNPWHGLVPSSGRGRGRDTSTAMVASPYMCAIAAAMQSSLLAHVVQVTIMPSSRRTTDGLRLGSASDHGFVTASWQSSNLVLQQALSLTLAAVVHFKWRFSDWTSPPPANDM